MKTNRLVLEHPSKGWLNLTFLIALSACVRVLFLMALPDLFISTDLSAWCHATRMLMTGRNPILELNVFNWPPHWFLLLFAVSKLSAWTGLPIAPLIHGLLIGIESVLIAVLYRLLDHLGVVHKMRLLAYGIALNPIAIYLVCVQSNFDVLMALYVTLFAFALIRFHETRESQYWLVACLCLGLAIFTKTVPFILVPLLFYRIDSIRWIERCLGLVLVVGLTLVGVGILYALWPQKIAEDVLRYRSQTSYLGITGIAWLCQMGKDPGLTLRIEDHVFHGWCVAATILCTIQAVWFGRWKSGFQPLAVILTVLVNLLFIVCFGSGYGVHWAYWFIPPCLLLFALGKLRRTILVAYLLAVVIHTVLYAFVPGYGGFVLKMFPVAPYRWLFAFLDEAQTWGYSWKFRLLLLPLFVCYLVLWIRGTTLLNALRKLPVPR